MMGIGDWGFSAYSGAWHHHEVSARNRKICRYASTFRGYRALRDLDNDFGSRREALGDLLVRKTGRLVSTLPGFGLSATFGLIVHIV